MHKKMSSDERNKIAMAYGNGVPLKIIIYETRRSKNAIYKVLEKLNLHLRTKGRGRRHANQDGL